MGVDQKTGPGTNPRIPLVVSKSDSDHGTATTAHRTLGLMPACTISRSNLSLSHYPLRCHWSTRGRRGRGEVGMGGYRGGGISGWLTGSLFV